jgi:hypothetical protein
VIFWEVCTRTPALFESATPLEYHINHQASNDWIPRHIYPSSLNAYKMTADEVRVLHRWPEIAVQFEQWISELRNEQYVLTLLSVGIGEKISNKLHIRMCVSEAKDRVECIRTNAERVNLSREESRQRTTAMKTAVLRHSLDQGPQGLQSEPLNAVVRCQEACSHPGWREVR